MVMDDDDDLYGGSGGATSLKQVLLRDDLHEVVIPKGQVEFLHDVPLNMIAQIGAVDKTMKDVLSLKSGMVVEFDKVVGEPMDVYIGGRLMCRGEIVVVNERYGIRISEVVRADDSAKSSKKN